MMTNLPFMVGVEVAEITPPLNVGILMSAVERQWAPFEGVRLPLHARAVVIRRGQQQVALISLDLLGLAGKAFGGRRRLKSQIIEACHGAVQARNLILVATHTHSAPASLGITNLYRTAAFKEWANYLAQQIGLAIRQACDRLQPCRLTLGATRVEGLGVYRRIKTTDGVVLSHPPPPPAKILAQGGPVDDSVNVSAFRDESNRPIAIIVKATCHPVYEMSIPQVSPDYPGEMSLELERRLPGAVALFFNGATADINPPTVSSGPAEARRHGSHLAEAVDDLLGHLAPSIGDDLTVRRRLVRLPGRTVTGRPSLRPVIAELAALQMGDATYLFIPGELFVEIGLAIRENAPCPFTTVVGYAEDWIGYIPTKQAFDEGGYELGPGPWARVGRASGEIIQREGLALLTELKAICT